MQRYKGLLLPFFLHWSACHTAQKNGKRHFGVI